MVAARWAVAWAAALEAEWAECPVVGLVALAGAAVGVVAGDPEGRGMAAGITGGHSGAAGGGSFHCFFGPGMAGAVAAGWGGAGQGFSSPPPHSRRSSPR